jgi:hypothetical protein
LSLNEIDKGGAPPGCIREALWINDGAHTMYQWTDNQDIDNNPVDNSKLWKMVADGKGGGAWSIDNSNAASQVSQFMPHGGSGASATCYGTGFQLGGQHWNPAGDNAPTPRQLSPGLLMLNMSTGTWTNQSATPFTPHGTQLGGDAVCLPSFGPNGLLAFLGGLTSQGDDWINSDDAIANSPGIPFDNITVYDPFANKWYSQQTSGTYPSPRHDFCTVGMEGPDDTFEM